MKVQIYLQGEVLDLYLKKSKFCYHMKGIA